MKTDTDEIIVSICCTTYNHEKYIAQTIESFLMQQTNFPYEILLGEDCSTDQTRSIIEGYAQRYPHMIKLFISESNLGANMNGIRTMEKARGAYIALCDGDDYWTDPYKLQKQIDFLENNQEYIICCHYSKVINDRDETLYVDANPISLQHTYEDILAGEKKETRTGSIVLRNIKELKQLRSQQWYLNCHTGDMFLKLFATFTSQKKIYVLPEVMSCYRFHKGGAWSMIDSKERKDKMRSDFNTLIKMFKYTSHQKRRFLKMYLTRYFLFDIQSYQFNQVLNTITFLL